MTLFRELIQVSIGNRVCLSWTPSETEWGDLYAMAKKQSLVGVCFAGVQQLQLQHQCPPEMLYLTWMGMAAKIQQRNEIVNRQCVELQARLSADGLRSCILKGQGVAQIYPKHLHELRQSGDIDVWIDAPKENIIDYVMKSAPTKEFDQKHIHYHCFDDTEVEAHWVPVRWLSPKGNLLQTYFDSERERQFVNIADGLCVPTTDFQLMHQLLHVYGHYVYEGVGMRQMMDLYFAQLACTKGSNSLNGVLELFKKLGLMRFLAATQWVLKTVFVGNNNDDDDWLLCKPNERMGRNLLNEIVIGGNFGHHDKRNHVEGESFFGRFLRRWGRKFRMFRFDPLGTLIMPFYRLKLEFWMRSVRRKYNV